MRSLCRGPMVSSGGSAREVHHRKKNMEIIIIIILRAVMSELFAVALCQHMPPQHRIHPSPPAAPLSSASSHAPSPASLNRNYIIPQPQNRLYFHQCLGNTPELVLEKLMSMGLGYI